MSGTELTVVFLDADWAFGGLHEVADPLDEALVEAGVGDVTGGGIGGGETRLEVTLSDHEAGLEVLRRVLAELGAPASTRLREAGRETALLPDDSP